MDILNQMNFNDSDDSDVELIKLLVLTDENSTSSSSSSEYSDSEMHHAKVKDFVKTVDEFDEMDFKSHMRLRRSTVEFLIERYQNETSTIEKNAGRPTLPAKNVVYMYLWYISNTVTYRQLAVLFGVTKSTAWVAIRRVVAWIVSISHEYMVWPTGEALQDMCRKFEEKKGIPKVLGAIDCTHITINAPKTLKESYFDRKKNYSLILQAIVDANGKFMDIYCGEPGSMHDSRVLRRSNFYMDVTANQADWLPNETFILGDSAYKCTNWLITPFKNNGRLTQQQRRFNYIHSATRIVVENAFGALKARFRRLLKFTEHRDLRAATDLIASACVLHNICIIKEGSEEFPEETVENLQHEQSDDIPNAQQETRRESLFNYLVQENII